MSASISFTSVAANARVPLFHFQLDPTQAGGGTNNARSLIIGVPANSVAGVPVFVPSAEWAANYFGAAAPLSQHIAAYMANDPVGELWALPVTISSGTAASATITFTGTSTAAGTLGVYVGGQAVEVAIASGTAAAAVATAVAAAIVAATSPIAQKTPVTATAAGAAVTLTSAVAGALGNQIDLRLNWAGPMGGETLPAGLAATVAPFSGGAGLPVLTGVAAALAGEAFDTISHPFSDTTSLGVLQTMMNDSSGRWSDTMQAFGHTWTAAAVTASAGSAALLTLGQARNNQHETIFGIADCPTLPWVIAGAAAGQAAASTRANPARPLQTLPLIGVLAPPVQSRFTPGTRQTLLTNGIATLIAQRDGTVQIERAVTSYQSNSWGQPDISYLDAETMYTLMYVIRDLADFVTTAFPRALLADDGTLTGGGSAVVTPSVIKAALVTRYSQLEQIGVVERTDLFKNGVTVQRNVNDPSRVDVLYDPYLMSGLRIFAALVQFRLQAAS